MALFVCKVQPIQRALGRSSVAAAAYRAGVSLVDERLAMEFDFSRKLDVEFAEVMAPANAPEAFKNRQTLWNAAEISEGRKDAVPAREVFLALPHELNFPQRRELVRAFVAAEITARGMVADVGMHLPDREGDERNFHVHILVTTRRLEGEGFGLKEAAWGTPAQVRRWRSSWAEIQNQHLRQHLGPTAPQVSHLSLAEQGIDRVPGVHLGPAASALERKGRCTMRGDHNRDVDARNQTTERHRQDYANTADRIAAAAPKFEVPIQDLVQEARRVREELIKDRDAWLIELDALQAPLVPQVRTLEGRFRAEADKEVRHAQTRRDRLQEKVKVGRSRRLELVRWVRNPARMIWAKHAEMNALAKVEIELRKAERSLAQRQAWLRSPAGQAMVVSARQNALEKASHAAVHRRTLTRKIKRMDRRIDAATRTLSDLIVAQELGVDKLRTPVRSPDATRFFRDVGGPAREAIARAPAPLRSQAIDRLNRRQGQAVARSLFPGR